VKQIAAAGLPTVSLTGKYGCNNQPESPNLGQPDLPARANTDTSARNEY